MNKQQDIAVTITPLTIFITIAAALAGLLFGYDAGIISGAMLFIKKTFTLSAMQQGLIVSGVPFGALVSSLLSGKLNDALGRKKNLLITAVIFFVGSAICAMAPNENALVIGRLFMGVAIGIGSFSAPLYIAEISEQRFRGALVTLNQLAIVIGILLAYVVNYAFSQSGLWRDMLGGGMLPAVLLFVAALLLPESPRWLIAKGRFSVAEKVLIKIHKHRAQEELANIKEVVNFEGSQGKVNPWHDFSKVLWLGILVSILTQAVGINAIIYYAPSIFQLTGFSHNTAAIFATMGVGLVNVIFTIFAVRFLDKYGRRPLLLVGVVGIVISLVILVVAFAIGVHSTALAWVVFASMILFIACQAIGTGPACWLIPSEIFPINIRGLGMGLSVACNWGANVVVAFFFPVVLHAWGASGSFGCFLVIALVALVYFYRYVPETKGISLEQIEKNLYLGKRTRDLGA
jgi:sugar porter (SP) family MFS transporter